MFKSISVLISVILLCISAPLTVRAADMSVYSADIVTETPDGAHQSRIFVKGEKQRMEANEEGQKIINIIRGDKQVVWMLMPDQKMYMEMRLTRQREDITSRLNDPDVKMEKKFLADEKVDGHPSKKYHVAMTRNGKRDGSGFLWEAADLNNFPIKWQEEDGKTTVIWKNIKLGGVSDSMFEFPSGYQKMDMPGMGGMGFPGKMR